MCGRWKMVKWDERVEGGGERVGEGRGEKVKEWEGSRE
jgi:hypothetical protein